MYISNNIIVPKLGIHIFEFNILCHLKWQMKKIGLETNVNADTI